MRFHFVVSLMVGLASAVAVAAPPKPAVPSIADKTAGMTEQDGLFPIYWDTAAGALYLEIPRFDTEVLYQTGLATGVGANDLGLDRGQLVGTHVVTFQRVGPKVLLVEVNYGYRARAASPAERAAVAESFARSVLWGFTVVAESNGRALVDATEFVVRDTTDVAARLRPVSYHYDKARSAPYLPRIKAFPNNTELEATVTLVRDGNPPSDASVVTTALADVVPSPEAVTLREHVSLVRLPDDHYQPRIYEPRAGTFDVDTIDFATPLGRDPHVRFAVRHRLDKKDPTAAVSEPVAPIVYYVDRGLPDDIRRAVVEGASWWRDAFEAAGFHDAFHVELMPDGADPMDVRYNVIDWVHRSTRGWSYGASIVDPRTGEIIQGHVSLGSLRAQQDVMIGEGLSSPYANGDEQPQVAIDLALARLRQLAAHEVGHTLGFRHSYYDSSNGRTSVMDYPQPLVVLRKDGTLDFSQAYATGIGEWDKVAVACAYGVAPPGVDDRARVAKLLDDAWARDLRFYTDEDVDAHPSVDRWSNGVDQAAELVRMLAVRDAALARLGDATLPTGRPMAMLEDVLVPIYLYHRYTVEAAAHALGGQRYAYAIRGDGKQPTAWVPAAEQRAALDALVRALAPAELAIPAGILARIPPRPAGFEATREDFPRATGTVFDPITPPTIAAELVVDNVLASPRAARLAAQHAVDASLPGLDDVIARLVAATFDAHATGSYQQAIARAAQRVLVGRLMTLAASSQVDDVRAVAGHALTAIAARESPVGQPGIEAAHRELLRADIARFTERPGDAAIRVIPVPAAPPGAPIGAGDDDDFLAR